MAVGKTVEVPSNSNSYLGHYLSRVAPEGHDTTTEHQQQVEQHLEETNPYGYSNNTVNDNEGEPCLFRQGSDNKLHRQPEDDGGDDAHDAIPRSPLGSPTAQPPSPQRTQPGLRWTLDSVSLENGDDLERMSMRRRDPTPTRSKGHGGGGGGVCSASSQRHAVRNNGRRPRQQQQSRQPQLQQDFMVDENNTLQPKQSFAARSYSGKATSVGFRGRQQRQQQQWTGLAHSTPHHHQLGGGLSKLSSGQGQQYSHQRCTDTDGRALSVKESSALFWEESESLLAKSSCANNDWGLGLERSRGPGGRSTFSGATAHLPASIASAARGYPRAFSVVAGRERGSEGRGVRSSRDVRLATTAADIGTAIGGNSFRNKHPRAELYSRELPLGQALRTIGGLVGADGAKVSAVGKHITSIEGVPLGVSSRATQLFLSNNSLRSLRGLESFSGVACLSLSHNLVRRTEDLRPLASLARLETLSLEGNPVCGAANYRAHVVSFASPCLKTLDRREVAPAETSDAPAIVAAERSATSKTSKARCLCLLLDHMCGLLECHSELREPLLRAGGGGGGGDGISSRLRRGAGTLNGWRGVWRQRPAVAMPVHQMLTVFRAENWPAFDQSELEVLERQILDEAVEVFAKVVTSRRVAGQRTHELSEGAVATLDSPGTRTWGQVLGEVHRRTEANESDIVLRFEGIRRREAERFRHVSAQTNAFLRDLAAAVGYSDNHWALPPNTAVAAAAAAAAAAAVARYPIGDGAGRSSTSRKGKPVTPLEASPLLLPPARQGSERGRTVPTPVVARSCPTGITAGVTSTETCTIHSPELAEVRERTPQRQTGPMGLDRNDPGDDHEARERRRYSAARTETVDPPPRLQTPRENEGGAARTQREISSGIERLDVVDSGHCHKAERPGGERPGERFLIAGSHSPFALTPRASFAPLAPSDFGAVTHGTVVLTAVPTVAIDQAATTTMASAAKVLLAKEERQNHRRSGSSEASPSRAAASRVSSSKEAVAARGKGARSRVEVIVQDDGSDGLLGIVRHERKQEKEMMQPRGRLASAAVKDGPNRRETPRNLEQSGVRENSVRHEMGTDPIRVLPVGGSAARQASSAGVCASVAATASIAATDGLCPAAEQQNNYTKRQEGVARLVGEIETSIAGPQDEDGGGAVAGGAAATGDCRGSSSEATRRLLREALRVKRMLAAMDRADAAASTAGNGLGGADPERFITSLGLTELKPLSARLAEALDRLPQALLGDPSVAVPEPRTTRGLRDQVAALGKEVTQRAGACAEARKLHAALRRQIEVARRARARNLDTVDMACRKLIAKAGEEVQALHESRRVACEAERYHATLACIQEQVDATIGETRKIVSESETIAWQLREEMETRGGELSDRRRAAEEGLAEWEQAAENDPGLGARRRAYDCEILVLRHRMGCNGANNASLAAAFHLLRARTNQQRRAREWFARATARRDALLVRSVFDALARGSRARAAEAAVTAARCRAGLAAWKRAVSFSRQVRTLRWRRERATAVKGFRRWRQRCAWMGVDPGGSGGGAAEERNALEWRLEIFRERRAKRVVFRAWRDASKTPAAVAVHEGRAGRGNTGPGGKGHRRGQRRGFACHGASEGGGLTPCPGWGARLRTAEALARRRRFETQIGLAFRWWRRHRQCNELARTARQRRALRCWRHRVTDTRSARGATLEARGSYVISLGRRVLAAWSTAAATRARRRTGAASLVCAVSTIIKRSNIRRWAFQAAADARETDNTVTALEHCYDRCLRGHLRAWSVLARERRVFRRGIKLLLRGRRATVVATGLRIWRRRVAKVRDGVLRQHRIKAWTAAAARRRRLGVLSLSFSAWAGSCRRVAAIHSLAKWAAARRRRLALAAGFRALCLSGRRAAIAAATAVGESVGGGHGDQDGRGIIVEANIQEAVAAKAAMEGRVGQLRTRLAQEKARALERHAAASEVAEEVARSERERARYAKILRRQVEQPHAPTLKTSTPAEEDTEVRPGSLEGSSFPWGNGFVTRKHGEEGQYIESWGGLVEPSCSHGGRMGLSELAEMEGELFGKLQAETLELRQRAAAAKKQQEQLKAEADRKAAVTSTALARALAEGKRLKKEAEHRKVLMAQLDLEAKNAAAQAAALSDRIAGAEQDLGFETTRNTEVLRARDEGNARLRAAAAAAEQRVAVAENALRRKGREIEDLRAKCAREGLLGSGRGEGGRRRASGGGRKNTATSSAGLEFRLFTAAADAQSSVERCAVAAAERRVSAGSLLAEALHNAGSETNTNRADTDRSGDDDGNAEGIAEARRLVADSVTHERREVAGLLLRGAEVKLRRSADLSLRASLECRPLTNPRSLLAAEEGSSREKGGVTPPRSKITRTSGYTPEADIPPGEEADLLTGITAFTRDGAKATEKGQVEPRGGSQLVRRNDDELDGTARTTPSIGCSCISPSGLKGGERSSNSDNYDEDVGEFGKETYSRGRNNENLNEAEASDGQEKTMAQDGLRELKREISNLEGKIMGRLGGSGGGGGCGGDIIDEEDDRPTGRNPSGGRGNEDGNFAVAELVKSSVRGMTLGRRQRQACAGVQQKQQQKHQQQRPPVPLPNRAAGSSSSLSRKKTGAGLSSSTAACSARGRGAKTSLGERKGIDRNPSPRRVGRTRSPAAESGAMGINPGSPARAWGRYNSGS